MSPRKLIRASLIIMLLGLALCVAYLFLNSLSVSERTKNDSFLAIPVSQIPVGMPREYILRNKPVRVLRLSEEQRKGLRKLDEHVVNVESKYVAALDGYVYWSLSPDRRCYLEHFPPSVGTTGRQPKAFPWLGGYSSVGCEVSYDYAGRAIRTWEYTYSGYRAEVPNLDGPYAKVSGEYLYVGAEPD